MSILCEAAGAVFEAPAGVVMPFLNEELRIDLQRRCLERRGNAGWVAWAFPYLELMVLAYLLQVTHSGLKNEMVGVNDLKDAHFFQGPHAIETAPLLERFGEDPRGFERAGRLLGGAAMPTADAAFCLKPFPKVPLYYLLWAGDEEFPARLSILFDRSVERHLSADAIWGTVGLVSDALLNS